MDKPTLPIYEVEEVLVERRVKEGKHFIVVDGIEIEFERRRSPRAEPKHDIKQRKAVI